MAVKVPFKSQARLRLRKQDTGTYQLRYGPYIDYCRECGCTRFRRNNRWDFTCTQCKFPFVKRPWTNYRIVKVGENDSP